MNSVINEWCCFFAAQWRYFLTAVMFFTRIPVSIKHYHETDLNHSSRYFPLVGIIVGVTGSLTFWLANKILPLEISILLSMLATILLTGAFHEDGLADAVDGLGGGYEKEQVLTIMLDSRIGNYGAIALVMALVTKYQSLSYISLAILPMVIIAGHALSRYMSVLVMFTQSYVKSTGKSKPIATQLNVSGLVVASIFGLTPLTLLLHFFGYKYLAVLLLVFLVWLWFSLKLKKRIGGYTGDCLGAMQQITEITFYLGILVCSSF